MRRVHILVVVLVAGVAVIGCYCLWASRPPSVGVEKGTAWTPSQPQQRDSREVKLRDEYSEE